MRVVALWVVVAGLCACNGGGGATQTGEGSSSGSGTTAESTGSGSGTTEVVTGSGTTEGSGGASTGEVAVCAPEPASIAVEELAETFAAAICAQKEACGCEVDFACEGTWKMKWDGLVAWATDREIPYDGECAAKMLHTLVTARGCKLASEPDIFVCEPCYLFQGALTEGAACETATAYWNYSEPCVAPARCNGSECYMPPELPELGQGDPCVSLQEGLLGICPEGTRCDFDGSNTCEATVGEGGDCSGAMECAAPTTCFADGVCRPRGAAGEPCSGPGECWYLYCQGGVCNDYIEICDTLELDELIRGPNKF
jgi:hypothetical protein